MLRETLITHRIVASFCICHSSFPGSRPGNSAARFTFYSTAMASSTADVSAKPRYVHVLYASRVETIGKPFAVTLGPVIESSTK
jgi:hypothetical protein